MTSPTRLGLLVRAECTPVQAFSFPGGPVKLPSLVLTVLPLPEKGSPALDNEEQYQIVLRDMVTIDTISAALQEAARVLPKPLI